MQRVFYMLETNFDRGVLEELLKKFPPEKSLLIPVLQATQESYGYLPEPALHRIGEYLKVPLCKIYGVITFYAQFHLTPRGKNIIRVCQGTACHVMGARTVLRKLEEVLGIKAGEATSDMQFGLETLRCLGTCFLAPVMMINQDYFGKMTPQKVDYVLKNYRPHKK